MENKDLSFFDMVHQVARLIPYGRVTSYGAIARYLGSGKSARMVGWAMNAAHNIPDVPAHRVVNSSGLLTGRQHFVHPYRMQELLEAEGIVVENHQVKDFDSLLLEPLKELGL